MYDLIQFFKDAALIFGGLGALVLGVGYLLGQLGIGRNKQASDLSQQTAATVSLLQQQIVSLQGVVDAERKERTAERHAYNEKIAGLTGEVGRLKGILEQKEGEIQRYKEIFQGKDPRMDKFMDTMETFITQTSPVLVKIEQHMGRTESFEEKLLDIHDKLFNQPTT